MSRSSATAATTAVPRTWRSLLTGRWHRSSWVVAVLVVLFLMFCNLTGQLTSHIGLSNEFPPPSGFLIFFWGIDETVNFEHGWPLTFLVRPDDHSRAFDKPTVWDCWTLWKNDPQTHGWAIVVNALVAVALAALVGGVFEAWRRMRQKVWQLHLRDVMALILALSLVGAWYAAEQNRNRREQAILGPAQQQQDTGWSTQATMPPVTADPFGQLPDGITWIRLLAGDRALGFLDRVRLVFVTHRGLPQIDIFQDVQFVLVEGPVTNDDLSHLGRLPRLVALEMSLSSDGSVSVPRDDVVELPPMANLKSLTISGARTRCQGFEQLPSLDALDLSGCYLDDAMLRDIARMPRLRRLNLGSRNFPPGGLVQLKSLRSLEELILDGGERDSPALAEIGQLTSLQRLSLRSARLPCDAPLHLAALPRLEKLYLDESDLRSDRSRSANWWPDLVSGAAWKTRLGPEAAGDLKRMPQLRVLSLGKSALPPKEIEALKAALPQCDVRAN
jgi:hypothetical protein